MKLKHVTQTTAPIVQLSHISSMDTDVTNEQFRDAYVGMGYILIEAKDTDVAEVHRKALYKIGADWYVTESDLTERVPTPVYPYPKVQKESKKCSDCTQCTCCPEQKE